MKVSNVSIVKGLSVTESIKSAIDEMFNRIASSNFIECLEVCGYIGTCVQQVDNGITPQYKSVDYFIVTELGQGFIRVEHCSE